MKARRILNIALTVLLVISATLFILSFALIIPCLCREFFYNQVDQIKAVDSVNLYTERYYSFTVDRQMVIDAFDSVMDYIWKGIPFKEDPNNAGGFLTGVLPLSAKGEAHFHDCIFLFWLDLIIMIITSVILLGLLVLRITKIYTPCKIFKLSPLFLSGIVLISLIAFILIYGLIVGFYDLFVAAHYVLFPGQGPDEWMFSSRYDVVVNLLNTEFFFNCALHVGGVSVGLSLICIIYSVITKVVEVKKNKQIKAKENGSI